MECTEARMKMSDYLEQYLIEPEKVHVTEHLQDCPACREELAELENMLSILRGLPREEPSGDLWNEFVPKLAEVQSETRSGFFSRVRLYFLQLKDALVEGWAIFKATVRYNWSGRLQRQA